MAQSSQSFNSSSRKNKLTGLFFLCLSLCTLFACVTEIDFGAETSGQLIISGVISASKGERTISVLETNGIEEPLPVEASGTLFKDGNPDQVLESIEKGKLVLPLAYKLESGPEYYLEIKVGSTTYRSIPQKIFPRKHSLPLSYERTREIEGESIDGVPIYVNLVEIFANLEIDNQEKQEEFYRWQIQNQWLVREVPRPIVDTFIRVDSSRDWVTGEWIYDTMKHWIPDTVKDCFPSTSVNDYPSVLLRTGSLGNGPAQIKMTSHIIDETFIFKHYFSVYLHRINEQNFEFYQKSERLIGNQGSLYDEIPALVRGNIFNPADSNEVVLGNVEFSFADTVRIGITKDDLGILIADPCRPLSGDNICFKFPEDVPCKCWDCDLVFGLETDEKPDYWE